MSAYTPCALRFYALVLRLTAVTLTHVSEEPRHSHEEEREESALAQVLFNMLQLHTAYCTVGYTTHFMLRARARAALTMCEL